jgi:hypothetical protein
MEQYEKCDKTPILCRQNNYQYYFFPMYHFLRTQSTTHTCITARCKFACPSISFFFVTLDTQTHYTHFHLPLHYKNSTRLVSLRETNWSSTHNFCLESRSRPKKQTMGRVPPLTQVLSRLKSLFFLCRLDNLHARPAGRPGRLPFSHK